MKQILTVEKVAQLLKCEVGTVQEKTRRGDLPGLKFGRHWIYPRDAFLEAINAMARAKREPEQQHPSNRNRANRPLLPQLPTIPPRNGLPR
ncbi:MAG: helix-turn-helix domain-containing protein [Rhodocyclales bacterium]|nr:helix-turn-helix domain-containing protein [Rhodocyclales bacterium]